MRHRSVRAWAPRGACAAARLIFGASHGREESHLRGQSGRRTAIALNASRLGGGDMALHSHETVRRHGHGIYAAIDQKLGKFWMVARRLASQSDLCARFMRLGDNGLDHPFHRFVLFVEQIGELCGVTIDPNTNCVRSLLPIEKPSNRRANVFARMTLDGFRTSRKFGARFRPGAGRCQPSQRAPGRLRPESGRTGS